MPTTIYGKSVANFSPRPGGEIRIQRRNPLGSAKFVVYETGNPGHVFGAGDCPALTARPPYASVHVGNTNFTVQSVDNDIEVI